MTDFAPTNYEALQPQYNFAGTLANGLSLGSQIQQMQLANQQNAQKQAQAKQMQTDVTAVANNPNATANDYAQLGTKYPEFADKFKQSYNMINDSQKEAKVNLYGQAYAAISNGNPDLANQLIQNQADAYKNAGDDKKAQEYNFSANLIGTNPAQAKMMAGMFLSQAMGPDKFVSTFGALNQEQRAEDKAPAELQTAQANAEIKQSLANNAPQLDYANTQKAVSDAQLAGVTANNAPQKQKLDMAKTQSDIDESDSKSAANDALGNPLGGNSLLHGADYLNTLPSATQAMVKAYAEGRKAFPTGMSAKSPQVQQLMASVAQYDPNFDQTDYNSRLKTRASFTSGKDADNITALNTAIGHLDSLSNAYTKLDNSSIPMYNTATNYLGTQLGNTNIQSNVKAVQTTATAVSHELAKVFRSSGMSEGEIQSWENKISTSATPAESKAVIGGAIDLMNSRLDALGNKYSQGMGVSKDGISLLTPKSQAVLRRLQGLDSLSSNYSSQTTQTNTPNLTAEDSQAIDWAKANKNDPRATQILQLHGM